MCTPEANVWETGKEWVSVIQQMSKCQFTLDWCRRVVLQVCATLWFTRFYSQSKREQDVISTDFVSLSIVLLKATTSVLKWAKPDSCHICGLMFMCVWVKREVHGTADKQGPCDKAMNADSWVRCCVNRGPVSHRSSHVLQPRWGEHSCPTQAWAELLVHFSSCTGSISMSSRKEWSWGATEAHQEVRMRLLCSIPSLLHISICHRVGLGQRWLFLPELCCSSGSCDEGVMYDSSPGMLHLFQSSVFLQITFGAARGEKMSGKILPWDSAW